MKPNLQIVRAATQVVWQCSVCHHQVDGCTCHAPVEILEEKAAKREANRQAVRTHREKHQQNQRSRNNYTNVEITEESETKKAEAKLSTTRLQHIMLDRIIRLLALLTPHTLAKFKRHWEENYGKE